MNSITETDLSEHNRRKGDSDMPWWGTLILKYGFGIGVAAYLIWFQTTKVDKHLENINTNIQLMRTDLVVHSTNTGYNVQQQDKIKSLLQVICVNGSKNSVERTNCVNQ